MNIELTKLRSIMFLAILVDSLFIAFSFRSLRVPIWRIPLTTNKFFLGSFAISVLGIILVVTVPFMQTLLSYEPLSLQYVVLVVSYGFVSLVTIEIGKWIFFEKHS